ncbi:MAG: DUF5615 family PIN-like protein [Herpetosiphonaceae bacterium]|nr:DUF5615 family PIN-like protein [Herpetosiphonaceae bacterium]
MANETMPRAAIQTLRAAGHDVVSIGEETSGITDQAVLERAHVEQRIMETTKKSGASIPSSCGQPSS